MTYAKEKTAAGEAAFLSAIYGGIAGGLTTDVEEFVVSIMSDMLDTQQALPPPESP